MITLITPCLWFDHQAEEAALFYTSIFKNSKIGAVTRYNAETPTLEGSVLTVSFELDGQPFTALNGGPVFSFSPAVSFMVTCQNQAEVDWYWDRLLDGGKPEQCGWLVDRFGVSWQIVPAVLMDMLRDKDAEKARRVTRAMLSMIKLEIEVLEQAYRG